MKSNLFLNLSAPGGRVADYRFADLGELMKSNRLAPWYGDRKTITPHPDDPLEKASTRLSRYTLKCPLTIGSTTIFNMVSSPNYILLAPFKYVDLKNALPLTHV